MWLHKAWGMVTIEELYLFQSSKGLVQFLMKEKNITYGVQGGGGETMSTLVGKKKTLVQVVE